MNLSERLKLSRETKGLDQKEVAGVLKTSISTVSGWENGYRTPPLKRLIKLAKLYETSLDYLVGIEMKNEISKKDLHRLIKELKGEIEKNNKDLNFKINQIENYINNTK